MSISSTVKKIIPYIKTAKDYVPLRLSSQAVEMDDGTTLEAKVTSLNSLISQKLNSTNVVNNLTTINAGYALDARQGKALDDKITQLNSALANTMQLRGDLNSASAIKDLKIGIYNVKNSVPEWLSFGWAMVYIPSEGVLNGAYAVSYASGTDAGMYYYSVRTSSWKKV